MKRGAIIQRHINDLETNGIAIVPSILSRDEVFRLRQELIAAIDEDAVAYPGVFDQRMVHNCMVRGKNMATLLDHPVMNSYLKAAFSETCIIHAYQSSSLLPGQTNFGSRIHVDSPRFIPGYTTNMGIIFPLDDFTLENGATYYLAGSHKVEKLPDEAGFYANAKRACCSAGDMIIFNARLVHAAGDNRTDQARHSLTINLCRSFMRQRFDFPRLVPNEIIASLGDDGRRLIGMNVRMPTSLEEFYLPPEQRLYKPDQG